jgi:hypothetical protein
MTGSNEYHAPTALCLGKKRCSHSELTCEFWRRQKKPLAPTGIRTPDRQAHSLSYTDNKNSTVMICPTYCDICNMVGAHFYLNP